MEEVGRMIIKPEDQSICYGIVHFMYDKEIHAWNLNNMVTQTGSAQWRHQWHSNVKSHKALSLDEEL